MKGWSVLRALDATGVPHVPDLQVFAENAIRVLLVPNPLEDAAAMTAETPTPPPIVAVDNVVM
jgi:hypothetical protein